MAGAINIANVAIGFDSSALIEGFDLSEKATKRLGQVVEASQSSIERYNEDIRILDRAYQAGALSADRYAAAVQHVKKEHDMLPKEINFAKSWTELHSKIMLVQAALHSVTRAASPMFTEMQRIDKINDTAHKLGMSYAELNTVQLSLGESAGVSAETVGKSLQKLSLGISQAIHTGKGPAAEAFSMLGLDPKQLDKMTGSQQLVAVIDAMQNINNEAERLNLTFQLFGRFGTQLVAGFDEGSAKIKDMDEFAKRAGLNLSGPLVEGIANARDEMERLSMATKGWLGQVASGAAPALGVIANDLAELIAKMANGKDVGEGIGNQAIGVYGAVKDTLRFYDALSKGSVDTTVFGETAWSLQIEKRIAELKAINDAAERVKNQKLKEERAKDAAEEEQIREQIKKFNEKSIMELHDMKTMLTNRGIDAEAEKKAKAIDDEFARRKGHIEAEMRKKLAKLGDVDNGEVTTTSAPTLRAGSVEAYKFMLAQRDKDASHQQKIETLTEEIKMNGKLQLEELQKSARFAARDTHN
jgi:VIT1/CCC1 family predicted Fe2+/Mn2+ transporter